MCIYYSLNGTYLGANGARYSDPKQGDSVGNCYLISALSSIAWVNYDNIPNKASPFNFTFWDWHTGAKVRKDVSAVDNTVCMSPVGARSVETGETWPAIYEKAYANFMPIPPNYNGLSQELGCNISSHRDLTKFPTYNPITTLAEISGVSPAQTSFMTSNDADGSAVVAKINTICTNKKTRYPTVAITTTAAGNGLQSKHSYSILGLQDPYIILRNPNLTKPGAGVNGVFLGTWTSVNDQRFLGGAAIGGPRPAVDYNLSTLPGVFGLDKEIFKANFEKYGWVTW